MLSSQTITDTLQLPLLCTTLPAGLSYSQLHRICRARINTITTYDISNVEIDVSGSGYEVNDIIQLVGGSPNLQTGSLIVGTILSGGHITQINGSGTFTFTTPPANPVLTTTIGTSVGTGARFNITWARIAGGCCSC